MRVKKRVRNTKKKESRKNSKFNFKILFIIFGCIFGLIACIGLFQFLCFPKIDLKGDKKTVLNYKEKYVEKGYSAKYFGKDLTRDVKVSGKVHSNKLGTYKIRYQVGKGFFTRKVIRTVIVRDTEKPKLEIDGRDLYLCPGSEVVPEKVKATDNYDGDISKRVKNVISKDKSSITYSVTDKAGNTKKVVKKIFFKDIEAPKLTLNGSELLYLYVGDEFKDPSVTIEDNCDSKLESKLKVEGNVDTNTIGDYELIYRVEDKAGNKGEAKRTVKVCEKTKNGTIYLTFDDGPQSGTTDVILDILKEEGVKATFFVTNKGPDELIKREYDEGHTVALHTATHDYSIVYASNESYFQDLYSVQDRVKRITGYESKIIRFPGGSSNTVSRKYTPGIMSYLTTEVQNRGFRYYDWNLSSGDAAGGSPTADQIYNNVVSNLSHDRMNMVLMHDIKTYTRDALKRIIQYGKANGYRFEQITMSTEMVTQRVNN